MATRKATPASRSIRVVKERDTKNYGVYVDLDATGKTPPIYWPRQGTEHLPDNATLTLTARED